MSSNFISRTCKYCNLFKRVCISTIGSNYKHAYIIQNTLPYLLLFMSIYLNSCSQPNILNFGQNTRSEYGCHGARKNTVSNPYRLISWKWTVSIFFFNTLIYSSNQNNWYPLAEELRNIYYRYFAEAHYGSSLSDCDLGSTHLTKMMLSSL